VLSVIKSEGLQDGVHCFIGEAGRSEDALYARECVTQLGIKAHIVDLGYDSSSFERFLRMCLHQEKPFPLLGNSMAMSEMYEKISSFDVPVVLDGTGGDEVFGGYWDRQYPFAIGDALARRDRRWLADSARSNGGLFWRGLRDRLTAGIDLRKPFRRLIPHPSFALEMFCRPEVLKAPSLDPLANREMAFSDALLADIQHGRLGEWIWQNDRNAMMASIENRSPLLDFRLAAFSASGYGSKFVGPWNKHELRKVFDAFTPLPTQWRRQKQGFRWNAREFYYRNAGRLLELIAASRILPERVNVKGFLDAARGNRRFVASRLAPRLLCIAGLEETLGIGLS
jgi:asparagine synthase (glutamine-hydrolysing)